MRSILMNSTAVYARAKEEGGTDLLDKEEVKAPAGSDTDTENKSLDNSDGTDGGNDDGTLEGTEGNKEDGSNGTEGGQPDDEGKTDDDTLDTKPKGMVKTNREMSGFSVFTFNDVPDTITRRSWDFKSLALHEGIVVPAKEATKARAASTNQGKTVGYKFRSQSLTKDKAAEMTKNGFPAVEGDVAIVRIE